MPFVDVDGNIVIKTETNDTPFVDDGNILIKTETDDTPLIDINDDILIKEETPTDVYVDSDIESSDDDRTIGDSDTETITFIPRDKRYEIYRKKAKKKAIKRLRKRAKKLLKIQNENKKKTQILVPTNVPIKSEDPIEILADPNVSTILLPQIKTEDIFDDITVPQITSTDDVIPLYDEDNKDVIPLEFDTDKIIMTDDEDIILTEPDNMQVEQKQLIASEDTIMLPPEENMTDVISTRNIVVKRKQPDISIGEIKKIKNETDISMKHPIFRKMEKQKKADERLAKAIASGKPLEIKIEDDLLAIEGPDELLAIEGPDELLPIEGPDELLAIEDPAALPALMPASTGPLPSVDIETMRRLPCVDFNVILDNTDKHNREQVIFDILQANMPNLGEDLYFIEHNPETNVLA